MFKAGDRVRILEIDPGDDTPTVEVGDVVTLCTDIDPDEEGPYPFVLTSPNDRGTYARIEAVPDEGTEAVDAALAAGGHGENTLTSKDTNPKDAVAVAHLKFSALPVRVLAGVALALSEGAWKYGRHNYRVAGVKASVYFDACLDHLFAWFEGEDIDPASGFHHVDKALAGLMVLRDAMLGGKCTDDRPPAVEPGWIEAGHAETAKLFERMARERGPALAPFVRKPDE